MFFVGKKHCSELGFIRCFLCEKKALFRVWYYYVFFVEKRHSSEFGIITCFLWIKGTGLSLVLLRLFSG